jgi:hypothetical protein
MIEFFNIPKTVFYWILKEDFCSQDFFLLHVMSPPTKLQVFASFWPQDALQLFINLLYFTDLSPADYFLFPKLKMKLKVLHSADFAEVQEAATEELKKVQKE